MNQEYAMQEHVVPVSDVDTQTRADFIVKTYMHLFGAVLLFTGIEVYIFKAGLAKPIYDAVTNISWLVVLGGFLVVSWLASRAAHMARSMVVQYAALIGFVLAEALIFVPLLYIANLASSERFGSSGNIISSAALVTLVGFCGLPFVAFGTRKDFSFLGGFLRWIGIAALIGIGSSVLFGFNLGTWFSVGMVAFAGAAILYDTSNIIRHYPQDRYVGAALELFASVALMFWYVLRLFLASRD